MKRLITILFLFACVAGFGQEYPLTYNGKVLTYNGKVLTHIDSSRYWTSQDWGNYYCSMRGSINLSKDVMLYSAAPTKNYGIFSTLQVGESNVLVDTYARSLIDFDFSEISDEDDLSGITLNLCHTQSSADNIRKIQLFRMKRSWVEGTKNGAIPADGATWNTYDGTNNWTSAGAFDSEDCEQTPIGELELSKTLGKQWIKIPLNITNKAELTLGYGFLLKMEIELNDYHAFISKDYGGANFLGSYIGGFENGYLINGTVSPLLSKAAENPILTGLYGSIVYDGENQYIFYYCKGGGASVFKRISADGIAWGDESIVLTESGALLEVCSAWKENSIYYMLYRSNVWAGKNSIGLATSTDGDNWTKSEHNPVITAADQSWILNHVDPWGIMKIDDTYYLWINDVSEDIRQTGLATSTDLINWSFNANNPLFTGGRYCVFPIKYKDKYYLFVPYTPCGSFGGIDNPIRYRIELYRDSNPTFLPAEREFLGNVLIAGISGEWDDSFFDTPFVLTKTIERNTFPHFQMWLYYTGLKKSTSASKIGLAKGYFQMLDQLEKIDEPDPGD